MTITNILSALGNNNSIYPLLVRDCGIENVAKVAMTYKQNAKDSKFVARQATRERIIDEYGTSAVWLGGIPLIETLADKFIAKKGFQPVISTKLFNETSVQGLNTNIKNFASKAPKEVKELQFVKNNLDTYKSLQVGKFVASTAIPIMVMGMILPKLNFKLTRKKIKEEKRKRIQTLNFVGMDKFIKSTKKDNQPTFTGKFDVLNISQLQKMFLLDGGLSVGRVSTARNKEEKCEMAFKMAGMCFLNYIAPKKIEKGLNGLTKKIFKINTALDPKILNNKEFIKTIKENKIEFPKDNSEAEIIRFLDSKPQALLSQITKEQGLVSYLKDDVRDPRKFVDTKKVGELFDSIKEFIKDSNVSGNIEEFAKKAYKAKAFNILTNVALSSFLLAIVLPKLQFLFRKITTGSNLDPGIKNQR